jgi:sec-independent protein translocase protein TatA
MFGNLTGWHALIVLAIVLLLFGAAKLPALAKSLGQSTKILRAELTADSGDPTATARALQPRDRAARSVATRRSADG